MGHLTTPVSVAVRQRRDFIDRCEKSPARCAGIGCGRAPAARAGSGFHLRQGLQATLHWWLSPFLASRRLRRRVVRACLARHEVNYGRSFFDEGQSVTAASAVEVTGLGFVNQLAQQAASANAEGAHDRCHPPLVAALLTPELLYAAKHLSILATLLTNLRARRALCPPASAAVHERRSLVATARRLRCPSRTTGTNVETGKALHALGDAPAMKGPGSAKKPGPPTSVLHHRRSISFGRTQPHKSLLGVQVPGPQLRARRLEDRSGPPEPLPTSRD